MRVGLLFPGQGSQHVGMGQALAERFPEAREAFEEADDTLGFGLSRIAWEGPKEVLTATENAQPALYVHSLAMHRVLSRRLRPVCAAAGHSSANCRRTVRPVRTAFGTDCSPSGAGVN